MDSKIAVIPLWDNGLNPDSLQQLLQSGVSTVFLVQVGFSPKSGDETMTGSALKGYDGSVVDDQSTVAKVLLEYEITRVPCMVFKEDGKVLVTNLQTKWGMPGTGGVNGENAVKQLVDRGVEAFDSMDLQLAAARFVEASHMDPSNTSALFNLASICHMSNYPTLAIHYFQAVLERDRTDMTCLKSLWNLAQSEKKGIRNCCVKAYEVLVDKFDDPTAKQKLATLTGSGEQAQKMDTSYARAIYEDLGEDFESRLVDVLEYRGPWILHDLMVSLCFQSSVAEDFATASLTETVEGVSGNALEGGGKGLPAVGAWRVLDLGCGSGLVGRAFGDFVGLSTDKPPSITHGADDSGDGFHSMEANGDQGGREDTCTSTTATLECDVLGEIWPLQRQTLSSSDAEVGMMAGADISSKMVQIASRSGKYHAVACCDAHAAVEVFCSAPADKKVHLVIAADTFIYIGALGTMFARVAEALSPMGLFAFSVEDLERSTMRASNFAPSSAFASSLGADNGGSAVGDGDERGRRREMVDSSGKCHVLLDDEVLGAVPGWGAQLLTSTRFAHSPTYIEVLSAAHDFRVCVCRSVVLRKEASVPVYGLMWILQKQL